MNKIYTALGTMSGTSMDGVDLSIIQSDGESKHKVIKDKYFEYPQAIYKHLTKLRDKIKIPKDLKKFSKEIKNIEKEITLFHARAIKQILTKTKLNVDFIGFHGQTIYHNAKERISKQLGDGNLLSKITKKTVLYNFRQNDLENGGEGAPLSPIFHQMLAKKFNIKAVSFFNIGGILNRTTIRDGEELTATDYGPGMCLIDKWIRINSKKKYDKNGDIAKSGNVDQIVLEKYVNNFIESDPTRRSYDTNDFNISIVKDLSLKDGAATLTLYTARLFHAYFRGNKNLKIKEKIILCGGGRKNKFLVDIVKSYNKDVKLIDSYGIDGDFVESQAFAYIAIRSYLKLPISFPKTTGCKKSSTGGEIIKY